MPNVLGIAYENFGLYILRDPRVDVLVDILTIRHFDVLRLYRLDLEVQPNQRENQTLEILHQVVETAQTFRVL